MNPQAANPIPDKQKKKRIENCQLFSLTAKFDTRISCILTSTGKVAKRRGISKVQLVSRSSNLDLLCIERHSPGTTKALGQELSSAHCSVYIIVALGDDDVVDGNSNGNVDQLIHDVLH